MTLWNKLAGELVDIVEYPDASPESLVSRFSRYENEIKFGAKLIVREGQGALFVNEGKLADVFTPGTYTLETQNLPILSTLQGWKHGFHSPFKAEVYFFSTKPLLNQQWGTQQAITMEVTGYGLGEIRAFGQAAYRISDPTVFFRQMVGTTGVLTDADLLNYLRGLIVSQFTQVLTSARPTLEQLSANLDALDATILNALNVKLQPLGFELVQFIIESLSLPPKLRDEIFEYSRLNKIDIGRFTQLQSAKSITQLADGGGNSGVGTQGMQLGVGLAAAQQVTRAMNASFAESPPNLQPDITSAATAPATVLYHVALNGKAEGPLLVQKLADLVTSGAVHASTLVWHPGMTGWSAAGNDPNLAGFFPHEPPPLP
jgi:membrane protease subunit (stomatin/prohibitin family)